MDIVFAGTPRFAAVALDALLAAGHRVSLVLTQPDRPAGRGRTVQVSEVKRVALARGCPVRQPETLRDRELTDMLAAIAPEAMIVAAYGLLVPEALLGLPARGCINIHASLLPRWRGAAPIQRAIIAGDTRTGISIMQMDQGLDTGPILSQASIAISLDDTAQTVHDRLAALGARMIVQTLATAPVPRPQPADGVTYAKKISKQEALIDWSESAVLIERKIRAFDPEPGAYTRCEGEVLKIWRARVENATHSKPGEVLGVDSTDIVIACGVDALRITELQRAGGKRIAAAAFLAGHRLSTGARFD
jgi:methionyl-tRNA formyltransferase